MLIILAFIKRHSVLAYYALVFAISWGGLLVVAGPSGIPGTSQQVTALLPFSFLLLFAGPSVAGILLTGLVYGRGGLREYRSRLLRWRVGARWYVVALLILPVLVMVILFSLSLTSPVFLPAIIITTADKTSLLLTGIGMGLGAGFLEELGWTGFAIPELRKRYAMLTTGLIVGLLWGAWHVPITFWMVGNSWTLFVGPLFFYIAVLPAYRVLMIWLYDRTGSLLMTMLMHASLVITTLSILQPPAQGTPLVIYYLILAVALWVFVVTVAVANRGRLSRQPLNSKEIQQKGASS